MPETEKMALPARTVVMAVRAAMAGSVWQVCPMVMPPQAAGAVLCWAVQAESLVRQVTRQGLFSRLKRVAQAVAADNTIPTTVV